MLTLQPDPLRPHFSAVAECTLSSWKLRPVTSGSTNRHTYSAFSPAPPSLQTLQHMPRAGGGGASPQFWYATPPPSLSSGPT